MHAVCHSDCVGAATVGWRAWRADRQRRGLSMCTVGFSSVEKSGAPSADANAAASTTMT